MEKETELQDNSQRVRELEVENARLWSRLETKSTHRRTAALLILISVALGGATRRYPSRGGVLVALAGTGLFASILLLALTPGRQLPAVVTRSVLSSAGRNQTELAQALGFDGPVRYVPSSDGETVVRLGSSDTGREAALDGDVVESGELSLVPVGRYLLRELVENTGELPDDVKPALPILYEGVTDLFRLADSIETVNFGGSEVTLDEQVTVRISGTAVGNVTTLDHPVTSLIAVGIASLVEAPVEATTTSTDDGETLLTLRWNE